MSDAIEKRLRIMVQRFRNTIGMAEGCDCCSCHLGRGGLEAADEIERLRAEDERAEKCTTCGGIPPESRNMCVCGGSGLRTDETHGLRVMCMKLSSDNASQAERIRELEEDVHKFQKCLGAMTEMLTRMDRPKAVG